MRISIIITTFNGDRFVDTCMQGIESQTIIGSVHLEIVIFIDGSDAVPLDRTEAILSGWRTKLERRSIPLRIVKTGAQRGVGYGRNRAIEASTGEFLCFQDIDDVMYADRLEEQLAMATSLGLNQRVTIVGSKFDRNSNATQRFTDWANNLSSEKLSLQIYTSNGPTIIMPTWFCHRSVVDRVGGFSETGAGTPEDLIFFYRHLDMGGKVARVDKSLLLYFYHPSATTFSIDKKTIYEIRLQHLIDRVLLNEQNSAFAGGFTIWNAGKLGKLFYRSLPPALRAKVKCFCDVDQNKIGRSYRHYDPVLRRETAPPIPVIDFRDATAPLIICMKLGLTDGQFEANLASLNLSEGKDYVLFS